jgi:hypothetical protein
LFGKKMRQIVGYVEGCRARQDVDIAVLGFGHLRDRLELLVRRGDTGIVIDSTGMNFGSHDSPYPPILNAKALEVAQAAK